MPVLQKPKLCSKALAAAKFLPAAALGIPEPPAASDSRNLPERKPTPCSIHPEAGTPQLCTLPEPQSPQKAKSESILAWQKPTISWQGPGESTTPVLNGWRLRRQH